MDLKRQSLAFKDDHPAKPLHKLLITKPCPLWTMCHRKKIIMNVVRVSVDALMNVALMPLMVQYQVDMATQQVIRDAVSRAVGLLENAILLDI